MLDPHTYRANEALARTDPALEWRAAAHTVEHLENIGFPVRIDSTQEVAQLVNSMQENRFDTYMAELGGLTGYEHYLLVLACRDICILQRRTFPSRRVVLPLSVMMSALCLYKKLQGINEAFSSVLEIGPGCGYLSFFARSHEPLTDYTQIEACESFYILQNLINRDRFGTGFAEYAFHPDATKGAGLWVPEGQVEIPPSPNFPHEIPICEHFPWWQISELAPRKFQIVTSNANLTEFKDAALDDYLSVISDVLEPDGALLAQCFGEHIYRSPDNLFRKTEAAGLSLVANPTFNGIRNALWIRAENSGCDRDALVARVFEPRPAPRKMYSMKQIVADTEKLATLHLTNQRL